MRHVPHGPADRVRSGRRSARSSPADFESPQWQQHDAALPRLRGLRLHLPDVPLLRHRRRRQLRRAERACKNWDACQFAMFTLHASGHNPRHVPGRSGSGSGSTTSSSIYPEKFGEILCTGCGNCTRNCPVGAGRAAVLKTIAESRRAGGDQDAVMQWRTSTSPT